MPSYSEKCILDLFIQLLASFRYISYDFRHSSLFLRSSSYQTSFVFYRICQYYIGPWLTVLYTILQGGNTEMDNLVHWILGRTFWSNYRCYPVLNDQSSISCASSIHWVFDWKYNVQSFASDEAS